MFNKNKKICFLLIALFAVFLLNGCDQSKEERASLVRQKNEVETEIVRLKSQQTQISQNIESLASGINNQTQSFQESTKRQKKLKDTLAEYVLEHKLATVALLAAGGGAAGVLDKNLDDDAKGVLAVIGIVGAIYCISNYEECGDVTSKIIYYGGQIDSEEKNINKLRSNIKANESSLAENKQSFASLSKSIDEKTVRRNSLQEKHDSLLCKFCF